MRAAGTLTELRDQNKSACHLLRSQIGAKSLNGNLTFVLVSVRAPERNDAGDTVRGAASGAVDHRHRHQRVPPTRVHVESDLVMSLAGFVEIDLGRIVNNGRSHFNILQEPNENGFLSDKADDKATSIGDNSSA